MQLDCDFSSEGTGPLDRQRFRSYDSVQRTHPEFASVSCASRKISAGTEGVSKITVLPIVRLSRRQID